MTIPDHDYRLHYYGDLTKEHPLRTLVHAMTSTGIPLPLQVSLDHDRSPWRDHMGYPLTLAGASYDTESDRTTVYLTFAISRPEERCVV